MDGSSGVRFLRLIKTEPSAAPEMAAIIGAD
jgi:hypothetical protein